MLASSMRSVTRLFASAFSPSSAVDRGLAEAITTTSTGETPRTKVIAALEDTWLALELGGALYGLVARHLRSVRSGASVATSGSVFCQMRRWASDTIPSAHSAACFTPLTGIRMRFDPAPAPFRAVVAARRARAKCVQYAPPAPLVSFRFCGGAFGCGVCALLVGGGCTSRIRCVGVPTTG
jgi:hypothetical protein